MRLLGAGEQDPEGNHDPGAFAGHGCSEDAGTALGDESFEPAGVLVGPDGTDAGEGDVAAVGLGTDRAGGEGDPVAVAALPFEPGEAHARALTVPGAGLLPVPVGVHRTGDAVGERLLADLRPPDFTGAGV